MSIRPLGWIAMLAMLVAGLCMDRAQSADQGSDAARNPRKLEAKAKSSSTSGKVDASVPSVPEPPKMFPGSARSAALAKSTAEAEAQAARDSGAMPATTRPLSDSSSSQQTPQPAVNAVEPLAVERARSLAEPKRKIASADDRRSKSKHVEVDPSEIDSTSMPVDVKPAEIDALPPVAAVKDSTPKTAARATDAAAPAMLPSDDSATSGALLTPFQAPTVAAPQGIPTRRAPQLESAPEAAKTQLSAEMLALRSRVRKALNMYYARRLNTRDHDAWETMHAMIAYGNRTDILKDGPRGERVNAISWLLDGNRCKGQPLLAVNDGHLVARVGVNVQGHAGQLLGMLAQWQVPADYDFAVQGHPFTVADLIQAEQADCEADTELTFKLIALSYYLPDNASWYSQDGQKWTVERLIQEEIKQPIRGAACGGTHRLFGLSSAYIMRQRNGGAIDGEFARAKKYVTDYHRYALNVSQNPEGSFSTDWFARPANKPDLDRHLQTSGHTLEWLAFSLPQEQLTDPHMLKAVNYLAGILVDNPQRPWAIGPLGHSIHALVMFDQRVFGDDQSVARQPNPKDRAELTHPQKYFPNEPGPVTQASASDGGSELEEVEGPDFVPTPSGREDDVERSCKPLR